MEEYNYLGNAFLNWQGETGSTWKDFYYFFEHKETKERKIKIVNGLTGRKEDTNNHSYYLRNFLPCVNGERSNYTYVTKPSDYLIDYMKKTFNHEWNESDGWWKKIPPETKEEGNLIKVDFEKKS